MFIHYKKHTFIFIFSVINGRKLLYFRCSRIQRQTVGIQLQHVGIQLRTLHVLLRIYVYSHVTIHSHDMILGVMIHVFCEFEGTSV